MEELIKRICEKCGIECHKIERSDSGWTNITHFVNDEFVIKVINSFTKPEKLQKEIAFYKNVSLDFIPQYVNSGEMDGKDFLIIKKLNGKSLYNVWHTLTNDQRKDVVNQIGEILNKFHTLSGNFLPEKFVQKDWLSKWQKSFALNIDILKKKGFDTSGLEVFKETKLTKVFEENKPCLIYNDAHFDNFLYDNGKVYLIDFDRVLYCSVDYELMVIRMMLDVPKKFANSKVAQFIEKEDFKNIYSQLKQVCPKMFDFEFIDDRVFIYTLFYRLGECYESHRNDGIQKLLDKFNARFEVGNNKN